MATTCWKAAAATTFWKAGWATTRWKAAPATTPLLGGAGGENLLLGGAGDDHLEAQGGENTLRGGAGDDTLISHSGAASRLFGGLGDDTLISINGDDVLTGGAGADDFLIAADLEQSGDAEPTVITDYTPGEDRIFLDVYTSGTTDLELDYEVDAEAGQVSLIVGGQVVAVLAGTTEVNPEDIVLTVEPSVVEAN